jgi:hypothetical protein
VPHEYEAGGLYFDDESLEEFIADARYWDEERLAVARTLLAGQRRTLDGTHPRHKKERKRLQQIVNSLERAIANHGG